MEYAKGFPKVWFAGRDEIARWWLSDAAELKTHKGRQAN